MSVYRERFDAPELQSFRLLRWDHSLQDVQICTDPGKAMPFPGSGERWHAHQAVELTFIASGCGSRFIGDHMGSIDPPELVLLGSNLPHYWRGLKQSAGFSIQLDPNRHHAFGSLAEAQLLDPLWRKAQQGVLFSKAIAGEVGDRMREMTDQAPLDRLAGLLQVLSLLIEASRDDEQALCDKPYALSTSARHADKISEAINLLVDHSSEDLTLEDVCLAVGLQRATLCRYFRRYTGKSIVSFLNSIRIDQARRLLVDSAKPVAEIAFQIGFGNLSHFNRQFRIATGESPRDYRKSYAASEERNASSEKTLSSAR